MLVLMDDSRKCAHAQSHLGSYQQFYKFGNVLCVQKIHLSAQLCLLRWCLTEVMYKPRMSASTSLKNTAKTELNLRRSAAELMDLDGVFKHNEVHN